MLLVLRAGRSDSGTRILGIYSGILGQCERHEIGAKLAALLIVP